MAAQFLTPETMAEILASTPNAIIISNSEGRIEYANAAFEKIFHKNHAEVHGRAISEALDLTSQQTQDIGYALRSSPHKLAILNEMQIGERIMEYHSFAISGPNSGEPWSCLMMNDVTEKRGYQETVFRTKKIAAIGDVISGMAHELNNPLTTVLGYSEILMSKVADKGIASRLAKIHSEGSRCKRIVQNLLSFVKKHKSQQAYIDIHEILNKTLELMEYQLRVNNVELDIERASSLPKTMADFFQMQQVFVNIINNADQAMLANNGRPKILQIRTSHDDKHIYVEFKDNGPGIAGENLGKIFDPFFTTKEVGQGTGLGLSLSYGIVKEHRGDILVNSRVGQGATFIIRLPIKSEKQGKGHSGVVPAPRHAGQRLILVADDEDELRVCIGEMLALEGYSVEYATNGQFALAKVAATDYDAILCDMKMPGVNGMEFYRTLQSKKADAAERVIFCTGDTEGAETKEFLKDTNNQVLSKPFGKTELIEVISRTIAVQRCGQVA